MKKILHIVTISILSLSVTSCSDSWLDLYPSTSLTSANAVESYSDVYNLLIGAYDGLQGTSSAAAYYGAGFIYYGDVRGDDMQARASGMRVSNTYEMQYSALMNLPDIWTKPYDVIKRANEVLVSIDAGLASDGNEPDVKDLKGQALTMRALAHFDLVRVYGKPYTMSGAPASLGVPILNQPPYDARYLPTRNTVEEVYAAVIADLTAAIPLLKTAKNNGFINSWAAKAWLARVYLFKGDYDNAYTTAVDIITNCTHYSLWARNEYVDAWKEPFGKENIFEIVIASADDWTDREGLVYLINEAGYADYILTKAFLDLINLPQHNGDIRKDMLSVPTLATFNSEAFWGQPVFLNKKYPGQSASDFRINNIPLIRLSEVYLIAAEAALSKTTPDQTAANTYLNAIISRRNTTRGTVTATIDEILTERRLELVGEGHRFHDMMRLDLTVVRSVTDGWHVGLIPDSRTFDRTYYRTIFAVPQSEMNANPNMVQNPGY